MAKKSNENYRSEKFIVGECRASYAYVFFPREDKEGNSTSHGITLMIPKEGTPLQQKAIARIKAEVEAAFAHLVEAKAITSKQKALFIEDPDRCTFKDGDGDWNVDDEGVYKFPEYKGHYILVCSHKLTNKATGELEKPKVFGRGANAGELTNPDDFVSGDYCFAEVIISSYSGEGKGVTAFFNSVKLSRRGEPFSAGTARESAYDSVLSEFPADDEDEQRYNDAGAEGGEEKEDKPF